DLELHRVGARRMLADERRGAAHDRGDVHGLATRDAYAGEIEELGEQARETIRLAHDEVAERTLVVRRDGAGGEPFGPAGNRRERVLYLVRQRPRQAPRGP